MVKTTVLSIILMIAVLSGHSQSSSKDTAAKVCLPREQAQLALKKIDSFELAKTELEKAQQINSQLAQLLANREAVVAATVTANRALDGQNLSLKTQLANTEQQRDNNKLDATLFKRKWRVGQVKTAFGTVAGVALALIIRSALVKP